MKKHEIYIVIVVLGLILLGGNMHYYNYRQTDLSFAQLRQISKLSLVERRLKRKKLQNKAEVGKLFNSFNSSNS